MLFNEPYKFLFCCFFWFGHSPFTDPELGIFCSPPSGWGSQVLLIPLSKITSAVNSVLPANFSDEMRKNIQIAVQSAIGKMNLVTREEVEEQEKQLLQLREKIEAMEQLVTKLEQRKQTVNKRQQLS